MYSTVDISSIPGTRVMDSNDGREGGVIRFGARYVLRVAGLACFAQSPYIRHRRSPVRVQKVARNLGILWP